MRRELIEAGELERWQVAALQMLDDRLAVAREVWADEEILLLQSNHGLRHAERTAEVRLGHEWFREAHAQARAFEELLPAVLHAERGEPEVPGMPAGVRPAAAERLPRQARETLLQWWRQPNLLAA